MDQYHKINTNDPLNYFRIVPILGEIDYKNKIFIIIFVTIENCLVDIHILDQILKINSHGGKVNRIIYKLFDDKYNSKKFVNNQFLELQEQNHSNLTIATTDVKIRTPKNKKSETDDHISIKYYIDDELVFNNIINFNNHINLSFICNDIEKNNLWDIMQNYQVDICFHIGNNIYGDDSFKQGIKLLENHEKRENKKSYNKYHSSIPLIDVENLYRECYQNIWNNWSQLLFNTSHVAIWDQHDVTKGFDTCMEGNFCERMVAAVGEKMYREYQEATRLDYGSQNNKPIWKKKINHNCTVIILERINKIHPSSSPFPAILRDRLKIEMDMIKQGTIILTFTTAPISIRYDNRIKCFSMYEYQQIWHFEDIKMLYDLVYSWIHVDINKRSVIIIGGGELFENEEIKLSMSGMISRGYINIPFFVTGLQNKISLYKKYLINKFEREYILDKYKVIINQITIKPNFLNIIVDSNGGVDGTLIFGK